MQEEIKQEQELVENQGENQTEMVENQDIVEPEAQENTTENQPETQENTTKTKAEQQYGRNFKALKEQHDKVTKERDEAFKKLQEYEAALKGDKNLHQETQEEDYEINIGDDELAEGKHLSKVSKKIKKLESKLQEYERRSVLSSTELRLKAELPDFDKVVTADNIKTLSATYPEIALTLEATTDLYAKAKSAYTIIKNMGIAVEDIYEPEKEIVKKNMAKPRSTSSIAPQQGETPLQKANLFANGLTEELKAHLRREMDEARKHY